MFEANEIQDVMSRSYGIGDDIDEADFLWATLVCGNFCKDYFLHE